MLIVTSRPHIIELPQTVVYHFFSNFQHFDPIAKYRELKDWKSTENSCNFFVEGLGDFGLTITERTPTSLLVMKGEGKLPFPFFLHVDIQPSESNKTSLKIIVHAKLFFLFRPFIKKTLSEAVNTVAESIVQYFNILTNYKYQK